MRRLTLAAFAGAIVLAATGCASEDTTSSSPSPSVSPSPGAVAQNPATTQPFAKPLVTQKPATPGSVPGLLQSTNGDARAKQVQASIDADKKKVAQGSDPFAANPPTITIPRTPNTTTASNQGPSNTQSLPNLPSPPQPNIGNRFPQPSISSGRGGSRPPRPSSPYPPSARRPSSSPASTRSGPPRPSSPLPRPNSVAANPNSSRPNPSGPLPASPTTPGGAPTAAIPAAPSTTLANGVEVTGVVQVGNEMQAIIKAPGEAASRYVRVGQRIANGQVLVKRIEMNTGAEPIVVLEENGVEVARAVGAAGVPEQATT